MRVHTSRSSLCASVATLTVLFASASALAAEVIIDNTDLGFSVSGSWATSSSGTGFYGTNYRTKATNDSPAGIATWQPTLSLAGDYQVFVRYGSGSGHPNNATYTVTYNGGTATAIVNQTTNAGTWVLIGTWNFAAGTAGRVSLTSAARAGKTIVADAVRFFRPDLTMAVSPIGGGTTTPVIGGPYPRDAGEVVSIQATPAAGYVFSQWTVSTGAQVASPTSASTTVTMDASKTVTATFQAASPQFRAFWADAFHPGFKSTSEIDSLISRAVTGNYNAIIAEVGAFQDTGATGHGAYWHSEIVPAASDIVGGIDPLAYLLTQAHARGIEVHCWIVAFRISNSWPPAGNATLRAHPEYTMVPHDSMGHVAPVGSDYVLDPGSPGAQEYMLSVVRELATNYPIDGIHWDYIRYTQVDAGYPADTSYGGSSLARFQETTGRTDVPGPAGDSAWDDFRRRGVTEFVRRMRAEIPLMSNVRQPLRYTASLISWGNAPSDFTQSSAYRSCFQDWRQWMEKGYLDAACPMLYYREHDASQSQWFRNWVNATIGWRYNRHVYLGMAAYLNSMANTVTQVQYMYDQGANGSLTYSYYATTDNNLDGTWENDWTWYQYAHDYLFADPAPLPTMPWRNPATATEGILYGRVIDSTTGQAADDITVSVGGFEGVQTDANGYYVATMVPATASGTTYSVTASQLGRSPVTHTGVRVVAGEVQREDFTVGPRMALPTITLQPVAQFICPFTNVTLNVAATGEGALGYQWRRDGTNVSDGGHYSGATTPTLSVQNVGVGEAGTYTCIVSNLRGGVTSEPASVSFRAATIILQQPVPQSLCAGGTATFTVVAGGDGTLLYRWQKDGVELSEGGHYLGATTAILTVSSASAADSGKYRCVVTGGCGSLTSTEVALSVRSTVITQQPLSRDVYRNGMASFAVAATGSGTMTYQWQKDGRDLVDGGHYLGATLEVLTVSNVDDGDAGSYRCVATAGCGSATSDEAVLRRIPYLGDFDDDGDIDLADFARFRECFSGPNGVPPSSCTADTDLDNDGDVDLTDFNAFRLCFNGPNRPPTQNCPGK